MADHYYSVQRGEGFDPNTVTAGTSSSSENIELRTRDGASLTKIDVIKGLETLLAYFQKPNTSVTA